jgi:hypothetical protein
VPAEGSGGSGGLGIDAPAEEDGVVIGEDSPEGAVGRGESGGVGEVQDTIKLVAMSKINRIKGLRCVEILDEYLSNTKCTPFSGKGNGPVSLLKKTGPSFDLLSRKPARAV